MRSTNYDELRKKPVTWLTAFKVMLHESIKYGERNERSVRTLRSLILVAALASPPIVYFEVKNANDLISGDLPPRVPTIRVTGDLIVEKHRVGLRQTSYYELHASDGRTYVATQATIFRGALKLAATKSLHNIYVEGFLLRNGAGPFWFTLVRLQDGELLVTPKSSIEQLNKQKTSAIPWLVGFVAILWGASFVNLYNLKHSLTHSQGHTN
jgi:hypothetical protein